MRFRRFRMVLLLAGSVLPGIHSLAANDVVSHTIVFGGDSDYPPFESLVDGKPEGFNIELESAIAAAGHRQAEHRLQDWSAIVHELEAGTIDVVPMFHTEERARRFHFSEPFYFVNTTVFAAPNAPRVQGIKDLAGTNVAVEDTSHAQQRLSEPELGIDLVPAKGTYAVLREVVEGRAQYAVLNSLVAKRFIRDQNLPLGQAGPPLWSDSYAFAVRRDRKALAQWLDTAFNRAVMDGTYKEIYGRWEGAIEAKPTTLVDVLQYIGLVSIPLLAGGILVVGWNRALRKRVQVHTSALNSELVRRIQAEEEIRHLARHEVLSGLPRRNYFIELADEILTADMPDRALETMVLHLNNLNDVTRIFGLAASERVVQMFSSRLKSLDAHVVGYFGGRTFGILTAAGQAELITQQLSKTISVPIMDFEPLVLVGIAQVRAAGDEAASLLRQAETALARCTGRQSRFVFYDSSMEPDRYDLEIVHDFRRTKGDGIHAVYQPQVALSDGSLVGCEALVRWNHDRLGPVSPLRLVQLLERTRLIAILTRRMVDHAVGQAVSLREAGIHCPISINISADDILDYDLYRLLRDALERHGSQPEDIKIELTETSLADDTGSVSSALETLGQAGIRSSIDDFGTGHASLVYLSRFPVHEVKIDRMFIKDMCTNPRHRAIVRSTIGMAHELGLVVVAEGAEDRETVEMLKDEGCDHVQGYAISRPLDARVLAEELLTLSRAATHVTDLASGGDRAKNWSRS